jgi:hypothetical protein
VCKFPFHHRSFEDAGDEAHAANERQMMKPETSLTTERTEHTENVFTARELPNAKPQVFHVPLFKYKNKIVPDE